MVGWKRRQAISTPPSQPGGRPEGTKTGRLPDQVDPAARLGETVINLAGPAQAAVYSAWAGRMTAKRNQDQAEILGVVEDSPVSHWSAEFVLGLGNQDRPLDDHGDADHRETGQAFEVLGLDADADGQEVTLAYRALAKRHHPDRWVEADERLRRHHAEEMLRINRAYRVLRGSAALT
jgi:hypothetical protein